MPEAKAFNFKDFFVENKYILLFLAFLVAISYANSLHNAFLSDDVPAIAMNPDISNFKLIFTTPFGILQRVLYFAAFKIGGLNPLYFRLPIVLFHLGATLSAFFVLYLIAPRSLAIIAATLFAVHPILTESVTWISGGGYAQQGFFFLLSLSMYILSKQNKKYYYFSLLFYLLAISASEKAVALCLAFPLYEIYFGNIRQNWKKSITFFSVSLAVTLFLLSGVGGRMNTLQTNYYLAPGTDSLLTKVPTSVASYFQLIFWPDKLTLYHTEMLFTPFQYWITIFAFLIYVSSIIYFFKKEKLVSFWLIIFILPLLATLSPLRIAWAVAERYAYLSTFGIIVLVAWVFYKLSEMKNIKITVYMIFWLIVFALSARTIIRNQDWKDDETLWVATEQVSPSGPNIHNNMGVIYQRKGENDKAIQEFALAVQINPQYADAYHNLGNTYYQMQKYEDAAKSYQAAIQLNPHLWQSHQNLAAIYFGQGWYDLAQQEIKKALEINPNEPNLLQNKTLIESNLSSMPPLSDSAPAT